MGKKSKRRDRSTAAALAPPAPPTSQALVSGAASKNPYVVKREDFRRLPRWPNDGIEQEKKKNLAGGPDASGRIDTNDPDTIAMMELLGGYPSEKPLCEIKGEASSFVKSLPYMFQEKAAREQSNLSAAQTHLMEAYKRRDVAVFQILNNINCQKMVRKGTQDPRRSPDLRAIIVPLFQKDLTSDENIELLFGNVSNVRHILLEIGSHLADPPPVNSPAGGFLSQFLYKPNTKATPAPKSCAECGLVSDEICAKCSACKTVSYCSVNCQRKHYPIHKPDCLRAQGKNVSEKTAAKAERKREENEEAEQIRRNEEEERAAKQFMQDFTMYANERDTDSEHWAHDCCGKRLQIHVPTIHADNMIVMISKFYLQLKMVQIVSLGMFPDGIDPDIYGFRGVELVNPMNDAHILVLFERLFANGGEGNGVGLHIDGVFVVDKVVKRKALWKRIPEPKTLYASNDNRCQKLVKYLELAKKEAKSVPETVDLGVHNPGDPDLSLISTEFGNYVNIS